MHEFPLISWRFSRDEDPVLAREFPIERLAEWLAPGGGGLPSARGDHGGLETASPLCGNANGGL